MEKGNIIFVRSKGIIPTLIRYFDPGKFNHVALAVSSNQIAEADVNILSRIDSFKPTNYEYYEVIDLGLTETETVAVIQASACYLGRKYDEPQLIWYALKKLFKFKGKNEFNNPNNLICSEFVFDVLDKAEILKDLNIKPEGRGMDLTPNQLYDLVKYVAKKDDSFGKIS